MKKIVLLIPILLVFLLASVAPLHAEGYYGGEAPWIGLTVREPAGAFGGPVVTEVIEGGPAWDAGLASGDVIVEIDGTGVRTTGEFVDRVRRLSSGGSVHLVVERDGGRKDLYLNLSGGPGAYPWAPYPYYGSPFGYPYGYPYAWPYASPYASPYSPPYALPYGHYPPFRYGMKDDGVYAKMYFRAITLLDLSGEQRAKVAALLNDYEKGATRLSGRIQVLEVELKALLVEESVDLKKVRAKVDEMAGTEAELRFLMIASHEEIKGVLTPEQRMRLKALLPFEDPSMFYGR